MVNKNIVLGDKNYDDLMEKCNDFIAFYEDNNIDEVRIFLDSIFLFCAAFLAAIASNRRAHIVPKIELSNINANILPQIQSHDFKRQPSFDPNYEFFIYTSGSTNEPKKIPKTLRQMQEEALFLRDFLGIQESCRILGGISHQHMFGLTFRVFLSLVSGLRVSSELLCYPEGIAKCDFTDAYFITSPVILKSIKPNLLSKARLIISAGSKLESSIKDAFDVEILEIYGSTESGVIAANFSKNSLLAGDEFEILSPVKLALDNGRLVIDSPWCKHFVSNDICEIDENRLRILGRNDRIIKLNDFRFSLDDAQNTIKNHDFIKDARCAMIDEKDRVSAILLLSERGKRAFREGGKSAITKALKEHLRAGFKTNIRHFKIARDLPYNPNGKFSKEDFVSIWNRVVVPRFERIKEANIIKYQGFMSEECFFYEGHFRDFPLTPGFIQLSFVFDILKLEGIKLSPHYTIKNLKFTHFLRPFDECYIEIGIEKNIHFKIYACESICASGLIYDV